MKHLVAISLLCLATSGCGGLLSPPSVERTVTVDQMPDRVTSAFNSYFPTATIVPTSVREVTDNRGKVVYQFRFLLSGDVAGEAWIDRNGQSITIFYRSP